MSEVSSFNSDDYGPYNEKVNSLTQEDHFGVKIA